MRLIFKDWPEIVKKLREDIRRSTRLTAADYAVRINARDDDPPAPPADAQEEKRG